MYEHADWFSGLPPDREGNVALRSTQTGKAEWKTLTELESEGWELCGTCPSSPLNVFYFKREVAAK